MPLLRIRSHIGNVSSSIGSSLMPFDLDISGVAGFFGGDATLAAMNTINVYAGRRWMGWYNQPGTYEVAKTYGQLAVSPFWDAVYPGPNLDPATLFKFDKVEKSAKYSYAHWAANDHSTSYLARLFIEECRAMRSVGKPPAHHGGASPLGSVTLVELPDSEELRNIEIPAKVTSMRQSPAMIFAAFTTMFLSCAAAAGCAVLRDWPCFAMIVLGMATNGIAHLVLSGRALAFETPEMVDNPEAPRAGVLYHGNDLVVLAGPKGALRAITKGHYTLVYTHSSHYHSVGVCSAILSLQFLAQLLVVPQGELRGQLLFLGSLAVSWVYNSYVSSPGLEILLRKLFMEEVLKIGTPPTQETQRDTEKNGLLQVADMEQYWLGAHSARVALAMLLLVPFVRDQGPKVLSQVLDDLIPLDTEMWKCWKEELLDNITDHFDTLCERKLVLSTEVKFNFC